METIGFSKQYLVGSEIGRIKLALESSSMSGPGAYTDKCEALMSQHLGGAASFLVPSCTAALEMSAILLDLKPGDEVIMPSFTFITTATAVAMRGATPVFVDVDPITFNLDPSAVQAAIGPKTRAIYVVHYGGVAADMESLLEIAQRSNVRIVEDAAQAYGAAYRNRPLGTFAALGCFSFHGTKNLSAGEGGALVVNDPELIERAAIIREKGSDRKNFLAGDVPFYTWQDIGSSFVVNELTAAFLSTQLEAVTEINARRLAQWKLYKDALSYLEKGGHFRLPNPPSDCQHNGHCFFVLMESKEKRTSLLEHLGRRGITAASHYVPLHSSPAGQRIGRTAGVLPNTIFAGDCLLRLPLWHELGKAQTQVIDAMTDWCTQ